MTAADRAAEAAMRTLIKRTFPEHGIIGEEFPADNPDAEYVWVLDPIDGTKSFICGMPVWGTLIALTRGGDPIYGMMHQPFIGEHFSGDGSAASYRGPAGDRALRARPCAELGEAILATTSPLLMNGGDLNAFRRVEQAVRLSRYGGDCYAYCMLAAGHIDLVIETELKPYDVLPLIPIIEGSGGIVTTWENERAHARRANHRRGRSSPARPGDGDFAQRAIGLRHVNKAACLEQTRQKPPRIASGNDPAPSATRAGLPPRGGASRCEAASQNLRSPCLRQSSRARQR